MGEFADLLSLVASTEQIAYYREFRQSLLHPILNDPDADDAYDSDDCLDEHPPRFKRVRTLELPDGNQVPEGVTLQKVQGLLAWVERLDKQSPVLPEFIQMAEEAGFDKAGIEYTLGILRMLYFKEVDGMASGNGPIGDFERKTYRPYPDTVALMKLGGFLLRCSPPGVEIPPMKILLLNHVAAFAIITWFEHVLHLWCRQRMESCMAVGGQNAEAELWDNTAEFVEVATLWMRRRIRMGDTSVSKTSTYSIYSR